MRNGRLVACDSPSRLIATYSPNATVTFGIDDEATPRELLARLRAIPQVHAVDRRGSQVTVVGEGPVLARTAAVLVGCGIEPPDLDVERRTLEDVYLRLVGEQGDDDAMGEVS
jgi:ABC-2 type transport system ATP-binding protein